MSADTIEIREARAEDLQALESLERGAFPDPWSRRSLESVLHGESDLVLVAAERGRPAAAYAAFRRAADEAELLRIAVDSGARRRGLAGRLLGAGLSRLAARGVASCFLEVRRTNLGARKLYEGHGFRLVGERSRYYADGSDAVLYRRRLVSLNSRERGASLPEDGLHPDWRR